VLHEFEPCIVNNKVRLNVRLDAQAVVMIQKSCEVVFLDRFGFFAQSDLRMSGYLSHGLERNEGVVKWALCASKLGFNVHGVRIRYLLRPLVEESCPSRVSSILLKRKTKEQGDRCHRQTDDETSAPLVHIHCELRKDARVRIRLTYKNVVPCV
jgi:hypothetical protein